MAYKIYQLNMINLCRLYLPYKKPTMLAVLLAMCLQLLAKLELASRWVFLSY